MTEPRIELGAYSEAIRKWLRAESDMRLYQEKLVEISERWLGIRISETLLFRISSNSVDGAGQSFPYPSQGE